MHFGRRQVIVSSLLFWSALTQGAAISSAFANDSAQMQPQSCPAAFAIQPPAAPAVRQSEALRLSSLGEACRERPDYFAYYGILLLTLKRPQEAALALEKALLLDPDLAGAQLDYAQALAEIGELASARSLANDVSKRPDIPFELHAWLTGQIGAWAGKGWHVAWSVELLGGSESNLNSAPSIRFLTLTLPGGNVPVELDSSESRRSGKALRSDIVVSAAHPLGEGAVQFGGEYLVRDSRGQANTDQNLLNLSAAYVHPVLGGYLGARVEQTRIHIGNKSAYLSNGWSFLYQLPQEYFPTGCVASLGHVGEDREFPGAHYQNGRYLGAQTRFSCRWAEWQFNLGLQRGQDRARDPIRLGGHQRREGINLGISRKLGADTLALAILNDRALDQQIYSPLLGSMARHIDRYGGRLSYEHPIDTRWSFVGYLEKTRQNSNIGLFEMDNSALYFGFRLRGS